MSLREFYESHYALEVALKTDLTAALSLPVGVLSLHVGSLVVMAKDLHIPLNVGEQIQLTAISLSGLASAVSGYFLFRSLYNFEYGYVHTPLQLKGYKERLIAFHQRSGLSSSDANELAEAETLDYIDEEYVFRSEPKTPPDHTSGLSRIADRHRAQRRSRPAVAHVYSHVALHHSTRTRDNR